MFFIIIASVNGCDSVERRLHTVIGSTAVAREVTFFSAVVTLNDASVSELSITAVAPCWAAVTAAAVTAVAAAAVAAAAIIVAQA